MTTTAEQRLATAANAITGINVTANYRQVTQPGQGFVWWDSQVRSENWFGFMDEWHVVIALPQSFKAAGTWIDAHRSIIRDALSTVMTITSVERGALPMDDGSQLPALIFKGKLGDDE